MHTKKEPWLKPIFRGFKLVQAILSFIVAVYIFRILNITFQVFFFSQHFNCYKEVFKKKKKELLETRLFPILLWWCKMQRSYVGACANIFLLLPFLSDFLARNDVCKPSLHFWAQSKERYALKFHPKQKQMYLSECVWNCLNII